MQHMPWGSGTKSCPLWQRITAEKQLLVWYWALLETECLTHGHQVTIQPELLIHKSEWYLTHEPSSWTGKTTNPFGNGHDTLDQAWTGKLYKQVVQDCQSPASMATDSSWTSFMTSCMHSKLPQSCPTLCGPIDCSLPGSSVHGILQARILQWVAMSSSRGSSQPRDQTGVSYIYLH